MQKCCMASVGHKKLDVMAPRKLDNFICNVWIEKKAVFFVCVNLMFNISSHFSTGPLKSGQSFHSFAQTATN